MMWPPWRRALDEGGGQRRRGQAHVACDGITARPEKRDKGAPELPEQLLVDLLRVEAADVVGLEYVCVEGRHTAPAVQARPAAPS